MAGLAIISGHGNLPRLLAEECQRRGQAYTVVIFNGISLDWTDAHPVISARFETPGALFGALRRAGCPQIVFAGAMTRPRLNSEKFDEDGVRLAKILVSQTGDDSTLRAITAFFESAGFEVVAAHDVLGHILPPLGILTQAKPSAADAQDADRAAEIIQMLGKADVGQGAVVAQGICLALESIQGTDQMLTFVANTRAGFTPDPDGARGVLSKAPKPGQDLRVDLPAIGPDTMRNAAKAGLAGTVITAGGVMVLDLEATITEADRLGLFLWVR